MRASSASPKDDVIARLCEHTMAVLTAERGLTGGYQRILS